MMYCISVFQLREEELDKLKAQLESTISKLDESRGLLKTNENGKLIQVQLGRLHNVSQTGILKVEFQRYHTSSLGVKVHRLLTNWYQVKYERNNII